MPKRLGKLQGKKCSIRRFSFTDKTMVTVWEDCKSRPSQETINSSVS